MGRPITRQDRWRANTKARGLKSQTLFLSRDFAARLTQTARQHGVSRSILLETAGEIGLRLPMASHLQAAQRRRRQNAGPATSLLSPHRA